MNGTDKVKFIGGITYWNKQRKGECGYDPFAFTSETYCGFSDPSSLFSKLLSAKWKTRKYKVSSLTFRENGFVLTCPYCGERFEVDESKVIRCPKCGNVIRKVNFEKWNENLDKYVNGEISKKELMDSPVAIKHFEDVDVPTTLLQEVRFRVAKYGFNKVYKFFTPYQLKTILDIIAEIRKEEDDVRVPLSLALIDFVSFNNIFAKLQKGKIYGIFSFGEPKVAWKWAELSRDYFYYFANKIKKRKGCQGKKLISYPFTLDMELYEEVINFYFPFLKLALSDYDSFLLVPRLFKEEFFYCLDSECNSYIEKKRYEINKDLTSIINSEGEIYVKEFREIERLIPYFHIKEVKKEGKYFKVYIGKRENVRKAISEITCGEAKGYDVDFLLSAFSSCVSNLTRFELIGVKDLVKAVYSKTFELIENVSGTYSIPDKVAKVYIIGKKYGKSKEFFKLLYVFSGGVIVKFDERTPLGKALNALKTGSDEGLDYESRLILSYLRKMQEVVYDQHL